MKTPALVMLKTDLVHSPIEHNKLDLPGGSGNIGETPLRAAARETEEETYGYLVRNSVS